jgi:hypothetical protein
MFAGKAFEPDHCQAMGVAFETVLIQLGLQDRSDPACNLVCSGCDCYAIGG